MSPLPRLPLSPGLAHGEAGQIEGTTEFDYDILDRDQPLDSPENLSPDQIDAVLRMFRLIAEWIWQDGMKNVEGLMIRASIACWVFIPHLHPLNLTQLARGFGKHKQSFGRWVDDWKRKFPQFVSPHMKTIPLWPDKLKQAA